ncbi:MAG TPA: histidine phosphatase family protein [Methylocystis sp.]|nr:histidine phosphatase family protein [Methylocystis sp.]
MTRTLVCLVRHGETNWNRENRFQGQLDIALNLKGRLQAEALGRELAETRFDHIFSSDIGRAVATAQPHAALRGLEIHKVRELREKHDGAWHGLSHAEVKALYPEDYDHYLARRADYAAPGGESLMRFAARVRAALTRIAEAHPGETLLVVAHAGVLDIAYRLATAKRLDERREHPALNAAPNWLAYENGHWSLLDWAKAEDRAPVKAPYDGLELPRREASRVLLVNGNGETLLLRFSAEILPDVAQQGYAHFWGQPGGALEGGESFEACAAREIAEETGLKDAAIGPSIAAREFPVRLKSGYALAVERYFLVRCPPFEPQIAGLTADERSYVLGWRWWRRQEIAASRELIFPEALAHMLEVADVF